MTFGEGSGCNGQMMRRNQTLWFEESACGLSGEGEETNVPTVSPANVNIAVTTPRPTLGEDEVVRTTFIPTEMDVSVFEFVFVLACLFTIHRLSSS